MNQLNVVGLRPAEVERFICCCVQRILLSRRREFPFVLGTRPRAQLLSAWCADLQVGRMLEGEEATPVQLGLLDYTTRQLKNVILFRGIGKSPNAAQRNALLRCYQKSETLLS